MFHIDGTTDHLCLEDKTFTNIKKSLITFEPEGCPVVVTLRNVSVTNFGSILHAGANVNRQITLRVFGGTYSNSKGVPFYIYNLPTDCVFDSVLASNISKRVIHLGSKDSSLSVEELSEKKRLRPNNVIKNCCFYSVQTHDPTDEAAFCLTYCYDTKIKNNIFAYLDAKNSPKNDKNEGINCRCEGITEIEGNTIINGGRHAIHAKGLGDQIIISNVISYSERSDNTTGIGVYSPNAKVYDNTVIGARRGYLSHKAKDSDWLGNVAIHCDSVIKKRLIGGENFDPFSSFPQK